MKFFLPLIAFLLIISVSTFAQEKSCCSSGDMVKKEVKIEKTSDNSKVKEIQKIEIIKAVNEGEDKTSCSTDKISLSGTESEKGCCSSDLAMKDAECCKSKEKADSK